MQGQLEKSSFPRLPGRDDSDWEMSLTRLIHEELGFFEAPKRHGDALYKGFAIASGKIMRWANSDDMLTPREPEVHCRY